MKTIKVHDVSTAYKATLTGSTLTGDVEITGLAIEVNESMTDSQIEQIIEKAMIVAATKNMGEQYDAAANGLTVLVA